MNNTTSPTFLKQALNPLEQRLQWRNALSAIWVTLVFGLAVTCILLIAGRLRPLLFQNDLLLIGLSFTLLIFCFGQLWVWFRRPSLQKLAALGDKYLNLDERLVTALELSEGHLQTTHYFQQAQLEDTFYHLKQAPLNDSLPLTNLKRFLFAVSTLLILTLTAASLYLVPNPLETILENQAELVDLLETQINELEQIQADLLDQQVNPLAATQVEEISQELSDLINELEAAKQNASPEEAMAALAEAEQNLTQLDQERFSEAQALDSMAEALGSSELEEAQQAAEALQNGDFEQAAEALGQLAENAPPAQEQADALADALEQAASSVAATDPELAESLQQAADALRSGDNEALEQAMQQAGQQLNEAGAQTEALEQLSESLSNIQEARQELAQQQGNQQSTQRELGQGQGQGEGEGEGQGQGQGQEGQGQQGQGLGQGQGQGGNGSGREDPGPGEDGLFSERGTEGIISTDNGPNQNRLEDYSSVYDPNHIGGEGGDFVVPPEQNPDSGGIDIGETAPNPERDPGESTVPYTEVYRDYADQANTALDGEYIPLGLKDYVRQYFGALEPENE